MAIQIPSPLIEFILLGPFDDRRQLQDSPILGDVWIEYGKKPGQPLDLLISPHRGEQAGAVAAALDQALGNEDTGAEISYLQGIIAAKLTLEQLLTAGLPRTTWWNAARTVRPISSLTTKRAKLSVAKLSAPRDKMSVYTPDAVAAILTRLVEEARRWHLKIASSQDTTDRPRDEPASEDLPTLHRFVAITALLLWAASHQFPKRARQPNSANEQISYILEEFKTAEAVRRFDNLFRQLMERSQTDAPCDSLIWQVSVNRRPTAALTKSVAAVKADAAKALFTVDCSRLAWAVLDSGIDAMHPSFYTSDGTDLRIKRCYDFRNFRKIVTLSNLRPAIRKKNLAALMTEDLLQSPLNPDAALEQLAKDARSRGPLHWDLVERFVEIKPFTRPPSNHGTHVAGIIAANKVAAGKRTGMISDDFADGMCPDISLYDFRVLGQGSTDTEFAIIAALQFVRFLNERGGSLNIHGSFAIHGVNLSLSIPHDVRNFACGRTPICDECERLVESGVVVVAAAGNHGYKSFETKEGSFDSYAAFSITDPGNADCVITVGATHRFWAHTYGVSFFSSRGPTGDGRVKPDLVAPGERIRAPILDSGWGDLDGTSMAAPHVSGAAAMLLARYSELIGRPRRIKQILCDTATDLGRERCFQGRGMLDVLRAFQSL